MRHLPLQNLVDLVAGQGRMEGYCVGGTVGWSEEWNPLDVIPVKVGYKKVDGGFGRENTARNLQAEIPEARATIDDDNRAIRKTHMETGRVPPKAQDLILRRSNGAAHSPKFQFETESVADGKSLPLSIALVIASTAKQMHYTMLEGSSVMDRVDIIPNPADKPVACGPPPPETGSAEFISKYIGAVNEVANIHPWTFPACSRYVMEVFFPDGEALRPMHEVLMSFQAVSPIAGAEWCVPIPCFPAAMADLEKEIANGLYLPAPVWLKKVKPETAWLSASDEKIASSAESITTLTPVRPGTFATW